MQFNQNTAKQIKLLDINQNIENNHNCTTKNLDQQQHFFEYFRICPVCLDCPNVSMFLAILAKLNLIIPMPIDLWLHQSRATPSYTT